MKPVMHFRLNNEVAVALYSQIWMEQVEIMKIKMYKPL